MKLQNLAIIFLIIAIPLILILAYYLNLQQETLRLQTEYDAKLANATKEGIKAFEINTVDWSSAKAESLRERKNVQSMVNAFIQGLANNLNVSGTAKEFMVNYLPAITVTMYDGYYIYALANTTVTKENEDGVQLFEDSSNKGYATTDDDDGKNPILYEEQDGQGRSYIYEYQDENGNTKQQTYNNLTTDVTKAASEYKYTLGSKILYSQKVEQGSINAVVNYTLDNRIYIYGTENGEVFEKDGYLVYFDEGTILPRITINETTKNEQRKESDIDVKYSVKSALYVHTVKNETSTVKQKVRISGEELSEQIVYNLNGTYTTGTFKYVYDIEHNKLYYDDATGTFFELTPDKERNFIPEKKQGEDLAKCKFKSISVLVGTGATTEFIKVYQVLNKGDYEGRCYVNLKEDENTDDEREEIDTEIKNKLSSFGIDEYPLYTDFSAINYYVEAYAFTNWVVQNLGNANNGELNIANDNDPENENSLFVQNKQEYMKKHITNNLNLAISNYRMGSDYEYRLPVITDSEWEQVFSNISMLTFMQGLPIGLKYYNGYAIATSTTNREYVNPGEIYLRNDTDGNYHRAYCEKCNLEQYTGYRSIEYLLKEYTPSSGNDTIYYYEHDDKNNEGSETACYYCAVNRANYTQIEGNTAEEKEKIYYQAKAYNEALARERYYQKERLTAKLYENIIISVQKQTLSIENKDVVFILDNSASMKNNNRGSSLLEAFENICDGFEIWKYEGKFGIGVVRFEENADEIGIAKTREELDLLISNCYLLMDSSGGGTDFNAALLGGADMIEKYFSNWGRDKVVIFITDGEASLPDTSTLSYMTNALQGGYFIAIGIDLTDEVQDLKRLVDSFPNAKLYNTYADNIYDNIKEIFIKINASQPIDVPTEEGRLDISDADISDDCPLEIVLTKDGVVISSISITTYPTSSGGVFEIENGKLYLSVSGLADACEIVDFTNVNVSLTYYTK